MRGPLGLIEELWSCFELVKDRMMGGGGTPVVPRTSAPLQPGSDLPVLTLCSCLHPTHGRSPALTWLKPQRPSFD
jgi:hypothetical protein